MKMNIAFGWFWSILKFFLFEWRFADWPWNVVILLGYLSISLILTVFEVFLVWETFRRLTLECCHSTGIPSSGSLFWFDFRNLRHLYLWNNVNNDFRLGICVFSRETLRVVFGVAYSARMTMVKNCRNCCSVSFDYKS